MEPFGPLLGALWAGPLIFEFGSIIIRGNLKTENACGSVGGMVLVTFLSVEVARLGNVGMVQVVQCTHTHYTGG